MVACVIFLGFPSGVCEVKSDWCGRAVATVLSVVNRVSE